MQTTSQLTPFQFSCVLAFAILFTASAVTLILRKLKPHNETFRKVFIIVRSWWIIIGTLLLALSWEKWGLLLLFYVLSIFMVIEYIKVSRVPYKKFITWSLIALSTMQYAALSLESYHFFQATIPILCLWIIPALIILKTAIEGLELIFAVIFGLSFTIYYLSHIPALTTMPYRVGMTSDQAVMGVVVLVIITWGNDVFQFIAGKAFGKRKIVPGISPNKTLAGFIGGIVCSTIVAAIAAPALLGVSLRTALVLGPLLSVAGMFGDLFFSAVKRNMGTKDFSAVLPGHGGLLDRIDSLIFTAPIFFHFLAAIQGGSL
jgi:phosphatidate cytidylyltransferase